MSQFQIYNPDVDYRRYGEGGSNGTKGGHRSWESSSAGCNPESRRSIAPPLPEGSWVTGNREQPTQDVAGLALRLLQELLFQVNGYSRSGPPVRYAEVGQALLSAPYESRCADVVVRPEPHQVEASRKYSDIDTGVIWPL